MAFSPTLSKFGVPLLPGQSGIGILMPKLKYRFRVSMQNFGPTGSALELTQQVITAARPNIQHNRTAIHSYNNVMYIPNKPEWQSLEIVVRDDVTSGVSSLVAAQLQKQMNHFDQTSGFSGINYKFVTQIETLDGGNVGTLENWYLEGCFLETVAYDTFDYASSDAMQITLTISYDNATQDKTIMPALQAATGFGVQAG
jgi:hypothetical protein